MKDLIRSIKALFNTEPFLPPRFIKGKMVDSNHEELKKELKLNHKKYSQSQSEMD